jgi:transposase
MPEFLTEEQVAVLRTAHRTTKDKRLADRIKAILSLHAGYSYEDVARILLLDEVTLRRYVIQFQKRGIEGLLECRYTGGISSLTHIQEQQLKRFLDKNTQRTAKEIRDHIFLVYRISYSTIGVTKLLHRLGFSYKKPKIVPGKADVKRQERFLVTYGNLKAKLDKSDHLYFVDATHPQHNTQPSYGWILKGKDHDKLMKTNTGRQRLNLNGALNLKTHQVVVLAEDTINATSVIRLGNALLRKHRKGKIYFILDNAKYHHATVVTEWRKTHGRIKFIFLPPYSPNLNLIERLWRFFHQKVTWNRYFETFEQFKNESLGFFKNLKRYDKELATLLTDNFQIIPSQKLQT